MLGFWVAYRHVDTIAQPWFQNTNLTALAAIVETSMLVMFATWVGALLWVGRQRQWRWFAALFITQVVGAGIAGMVSYAGNGPEDPGEIVRREVA